MMVQACLKNTPAYCQILPVIVKSPPRGQQAHMTFAEGFTIKGKV
jgi:hypothetical protein